MVAQWLTVIGGICMALFPPLAYSDQYISICRKRTSAGFSIDIPGLLIVANVTRCIYWLGARFQVYLLVQSVLMIAAQFGILYVCLLYRDPNSTLSTRKRPANLWQWETFPPYLEFTALLLLMHCVVFLFLHRVNFYVQLLGFIALGLEATLPIPQLVVNYQNKSTAGFRHTVLAGWFLGDAFKTIYYFSTPDNGIAFKACAVFQLSVDCMLLVQTFWYRHQTRLDLETRARVLLADDENENGRRRGGVGDLDEDDDEERGHEDGGGRAAGGGKKHSSTTTNTNRPSSSILLAKDPGVAGPDSLLLQLGRPARGGGGGGGRRGGGGGVDEQQQHHVGESSETVFEVGGEEEDDEDEDEDEAGDDHKLRSQETTSRKQGSR